MSNEKPVRARAKRGQYRGDNPETPEVNEAWVGGKSPKDLRDSEQDFPPYSAAHKAKLLRGE